MRWSELSRPWKFVMGVSVALVGAAGLGLIVPHVSQTANICNATPFMVVTHRVQIVGRGMLERVLAPGDCLAVFGGHTLTARSSDPLITEVTPERPADMRWEQSQPETSAETGGAFRQARAFWRIEGMFTLLDEAIPAPVIGADGSTLGTWLRNAAELSRTLNARLLLPVEQLDEGDRFTFGTVGRVAESREDSLSLGVPMAALLVGGPLDMAHIPPEAKIVTIDGRWMYGEADLRVAKAELAARSGADGTAGIGFTYGGSNYSAKVGLMHDCGHPHNVAIADRDGFLVGGADAAFIAGPEARVAADVIATGIKNIFTAARNMQSASAEPYESLPSLKERRRVYADQRQVIYTCSPESAAAGLLVGAFANPYRRVAAGLGIVRAAGPGVRAAILNAGWEAGEATLTSIVSAPNYWNADRRQEDRVNNATLAAKMGAVAGITFGS